jgi:hypothetical protein
MRISKKLAEGRLQRAEDRGKIVDLRFEIADLSFGLPPFGRVPSFGLWIEKRHGAWSMGHRERSQRSESRIS